MIFPDLNLLLYAYNTSAPEHKASKAWLENVINDTLPICFSWHTILGLIRMSTTPRIFPVPYTSKEALDIAESLMNRPNARMLEPGDNHFSIFKKLVTDSGFSGPRLSDVHIAALAIEHGATVASNDSDFRVFAGLKLINPLTGN